MSRSAKGVLIFLLLSLIVLTPNLRYNLPSKFQAMEIAANHKSTKNLGSIQLFEHSLNPKIVRPNQRHDANGDKIADNLAKLICEKTQCPPNPLNVMQTEEQTIQVTICVIKKPTVDLINKLRGYGAEISKVYDNLVYAISARIPFDAIHEIAADPEVVFIEKEAYSSVHLDTSTVNLGVRGSPYVGNATPAIKGNPNYAIAFLDTGVDSSHMDMANFIFFHDFTDAGYPNGTTGIDYGHHGTHCASIAAGTGAADTNPLSTNQTISLYFHWNIGWYWTTHWFEVKDHPNTPSTNVTLNWNTTGGGQIQFGIMNSSGTLITSTGPYSNSPLTHNLGNLEGGWYQVVCLPENGAATNQDYTITIASEANYTLSSEPTNTPVFSGVAPQSNIVCLKILDDTGSGTGSWFQDAINWISIHGKDPAYNITTVSMSIGFDGVYPSVDTAVNNLVDQGFVCVSSAGNDGTNNGNNAISSPGTAQKCITVGAVNDAFEVTYYSSNGDEIYSKPDVLAPGGTIVLSDSNSTHNLILAADSNYGEDANSMMDVVPNDYRGMQGTSMSCPHVSGLVQLIIDAMIQTEGTYTWSQANALKIKQLICMGTWEVNAGETSDWDGDGIPQTPLLNRTGSDAVEGYGMVRADAVIQAITHPTVSAFDEIDYYLDRRWGSSARYPKVLLFSFAAQAGQLYNFSINVPSTGDFDLLIYDSDFNSSTGRPIISNHSISNGLGVDEVLVFSPSESGIFFWSIRAVEGYGTCQVSLDINSFPSLHNPSPADGATEVSTSPTLRITVSDAETDFMDVSFYNGSDDSLLAIRTHVLNGTAANLIWTGLTEGRTYNWYVVVTDGQLSTQSPTWIFTTLQDNPTWDTTPRDQVVDIGQTFWYNLGASDSSGIAYYTVNDTRFSIDNTGLLTNNSVLSLGVYSLEVRAYDPYDNYCSATFRLTVQEPTITIPPELMQYINQLHFIIVVQFALIIGLVIIMLVLLIKRRTKTS